MRTRNEDAFLVADLADGAPEFENGIARFDVGPRGAILALSDGMGGHKAGNVASVMTLSQLHRALATRTSTPAPDERLVRAAEHANAAVYEAGKRPSLSQMGATVTALLIEGAVAHVGQVGDSRAYLIRNGRMVQLTRDQSLVEVAVRAGTMTATEAAESPLRNVILQAVGQTPEVRVAVSVLELRRRDCLLLCSDGLTNELEDEEIRDIVLAAPSLAAASEALTARANEHGGADNVTVILAGVNGDMPLPETEEGLGETYRVLSSFDAYRALNG